MAFHLFIYLYIIKSYTRYK